MLELKLRRLTGEHNRKTVMGVLFVDDKLSFTTLEPPWFNNEPKQSCIPDGVYRCARVDSPRFGLTYTVQEVPNRDLIRFHGGNYETDTDGCILVASGFIPNGRGISDAQKAMSVFRQIVRQHDSALLSIGWV